MLRTRLLTAAAATAMLVAPAAFAQTPAPQTPPATMPAPATTPAPVTPPAATTAPAAATTQAPAPAAQTNSVIDVLKAQGKFSTLLSALDQAQLTETLSSRPAITIFAPTDEAFAALPEAERTRLMDPANAQELRSLLLYHVLVADVEEGQIKGAAGPVETAGGAKIQIDGTGESIKADAATVTQAELDASNGGVFPIDRVLNPAQSQAAMGDEDAAAPAADAAAPATTTPAPAAAAPATPSATTTTAPAQPGTTAPNGQPAATTTTTAAPPVSNPTDGQVDNPARTTPPVQTPDPADGDEDGSEPPAQPQS